MSLSKKSMLMICTITSILVLSTILSGCTDTRKAAVEYLSFSTDGTKLVSVTEWITPPWDSNIPEGRDMQIWDIDSGEIIYSQFPAPVTYLDKDICFLSPDGTYLVMGSSIYNILSNAIEMNFSNDFQDWSTDGKLFAMKKSSNTIEIWDGINFTKMKNIVLNETIASYHRMKFSPDGKELAFIPDSKNSIFLINLTSHNVSILENTTKNFTSEFTNYWHKISWSKDYTKIGLVYAEKNIFIWNRKNGSLLNELHLNVTSIPIISYDFERYGYVNIPIVPPENGKSGYWDYKNAVFEIYNISNGNKILELDTGPVTFPPYDWSHDGSIITTGNEYGIIKIWNASTGELIKNLETPIHEFEIPGFELIPAVCAIALVLLWKRKTVMMG